jgi:7,8-dihydroneopterin aldolase/epimerase/oxygenase
MRTISIDRLRVHASIGILDHELVSRQPLLITVRVVMPQADALPKLDDVRQVLDYRRIRDIAKREAEGPHINMLETLAGRIGAKLLELPGVERCSVSVTKPNIFEDADGVTVEVLSERSAATPGAQGHG